MSWNRDGLHVHLASVETLVQREIPAPKAWTDLRQRFASFVELATPIVDRLANEVLDPSTNGDIEVLRALALAEEAANSQVDANVTGHVRRAVYDRMLELYAPAALKNYKAAAQQFNALADKFAGYAKTVDVEASSEQVVHLDDKGRTAWLDAAVVAEQLTDWMPVLAAAATLAGADPDVAMLSQESEGWRISLTVDTGKVHRRRMWEAWTNYSGRTGRWGALHSLGVKIAATNDPAQLEYYREPAPMQTKMQQGQFGGYDRIPVDPEDTPAASLVDKVKEAIWST